LYFFYAVSTRKKYLRQFQDFNELSENIVLFNTFWKNPSLPSLMTRLCSQKVKPQKKEKRSARKRGGVSDAYKSSTKAYNGMEGCGGENYGESLVRRRIALRVHRFASLIK